MRVVRVALRGAPLTFVFDRPRRPLFLAEGVQRRHPAVRLCVDMCAAREQELDRIHAIRRGGAHQRGRTVLAGRVDVGLRSDQYPRDRGFALRRGDHQRRHAGFVGRIHIRAARDQRFDGVRLAVQHRVRERLARGLRPQLEDTEERAEDTECDARHIRP